MNVLVTGGAGYLGSVLVPQLLRHGHRVRVLDIGYFGLDHVRSLGPDVEVMPQDICRLMDDPSVGEQAFENVDAVIHLAAISDDQSGELDPGLTYRVNIEATKALGEMARQRGASFLFASSCAVYGSVDGELSEESPLNPQSTYARSKLDAETALQALVSETWTPLMFRNGTLFGYSPRMRFDVVVNIFCLQSALEGEVRIFGHGLQWRPYINVKDCARALVHFVEHPQPTHSVYNLVHQNLRVVDLAAVFQDINPQIRVTHVPIDREDNRSYAVLSKRATSDGFCGSIGLAEGVTVVIEAIRDGRIPEPQSPAHRNARWLKMALDGSAWADGAGVAS